MEKIRCIGCGNIIQTEDPTKEGYLPPKVLEKRSLDDVICQRCFKMKHYNIIEKTTKNEDNFINELEKVDKKDSLFIYIVDSFDIEGSFVYRINRILGEANILLVLNKTDLFPSSTNFNKFLNLINKEIKESGLKVLDKVLVSAKSDKNIDVIVDYITKTKLKNIYFIGCTNTGKSSILNKVLRILFDLDKDYLLTKNMVSTTLSTIEIPFKNKLLCDTPGIINNKQIFNYVDIKDVKKIIPEKKIKPKSFQLKENDCLLVENLLSMHYKEGSINGFIFYMNSNMKFHRTNLNKVDDLLTTNKISNINKTETEYNTYKFNIKDQKKHNIFICGLGIISFYGTGKINIKVLGNTGVYLKDAYI